MQQDTTTRSFVKTISWRTWATVSTAILVLLFTGKWELAVSIGAIEVVLKLVLYFVHERMWNTIKFGRREVKPAVIWLTGLPAAGKTTVAKGVVEKLRKERFKVQHIDSHVVRNLFPTIGFSREDRDLHIQRVGYLASTLEKNGVFVVASFVSPYEDSRAFVRGLCDNFVEVYVSTPKEICETRDEKGLYEKARKGLVKNLTGVNDPYEAPKLPEVEIDMTNFSAEEATDEVMKHVKKAIS